MGTTTTLRIAQVSDPHLSTLAQVTAAELCNKRILGYLSWRWRRRREHRAEVLALLLDDLLARAPDHVVVTGDLTHVGTPAECAQALRWLEDLAARAPLSLVPGNHDRYVSAPWHDTVGRWTPYMGGDAGLAQDPASLFPALRVRGPVAIIGLSTAVPSPPFCATGTLGTRQLDALERMLMDTAAAGLFRLVVLHHPPLPPPRDLRRSLTDATALQQVLRRAGAECILHGHSHCWLETTVPGPRDGIPSLGTPSASALTHRPGRRAGYNILDITGTAGAWQVDVARYGLDATATGVEQLGTTTFRRAAVNAPAAVPGDR